MADAAVDPLQNLLSSYPSGVLLLRDSLAASGHFLLPWITAAAVKQGHKVVFIAAAYSPAKHQAALRKLGVTSSTSSTSSSSSEQQTGPVVFVSVAEAARRQHQQQQQQQSCLRLLYQQVQAAAAELSGVNAQQQQQQGLTVVLDSLSVLSALSYFNAGGGGVSSSSSQLQALVHQLMALGENLQVPSYRLILLAARDVPCQHQLLSSVASRAHVTADVNPLEGKTAALDGSLTINTRRAPPPRTRPLLPPQQLQLQESLQAGDDAALSTAPAAAGAGAAAAVAGGSVCPVWLSVGSSSVWLFRCGDVAIKWMREVHGKELMG